LDVYLGKQFTKHLFTGKSRGLFILEFLNLQEFRNSTNKFQQQHAERTLWSLHVWTCLASRVGKITDQWALPARPTRVPSYFMS